MPNDQAVSGSRAASAQAALATVEPRPGVPKPDPIMVADHVRRSFGGLTAVNVEHVEIQRGAITALIGPNGAGKTTFFNLITGFDNANEGTWTFNDRQVDGTAPYKLARIGMVRTFQLTK
ncbi:MAG: ATP-binding cassette domain-containing protein, partial [Candidatus Nanopelagicales bacterium]|nr:ATP-binding cassette domain-containing protein [Candidatus Nanopelagicales bacterium]